MLDVGKTLPPLLSSRFSKNDDDDWIYNCDIEGFDLFVCLMKEKCGDTCLLLSTAQRSYKINLTIRSDETYSVTADYFKIKINSFDSDDIKCLYSYSEARCTLICDIVAYIHLFEEMIRDSFADFNPKVKFGRDTETFIIHGNLGFLHFENDNRFKVKAFGNGMGENSYIYFKCSIGDSEHETDVGSLFPAIADKLNWFPIGF